MSTYYYALRINLAVPHLRILQHSLLSVFLEFIYSYHKVQCRTIIQFSSRSSGYCEQTRQSSQRRCVATELPCVNQALESSRGEQSSPGTSGEPWRLLRLHLCSNMGSKFSPLVLLSFLRSFHATELTRYQDAHFLILFNV